MRKKCSAADSEDNFRYVIKARSSEGGTEERTCE